MRSVNFGRSGLRVSQLCLGTMTFGDQCDEAQSHKILDTAFDAGIDFLDSANVYPFSGDAPKGRTEEIIGAWMKGKRQDVIIATKAFGPMGPKPWQRGMSRKHLLDAVDASLRRLQTDYIDLYQIHAWNHETDPATGLDEALDALDTIVRQGKARYVGVSNWPAHRIARSLGRSEARNLVKVISVQPRYNLLFRLYERELFELCQEEGLAVMPYSPNAGGMLSGKHRPGVKSEGRGSSPQYQERFFKPEILAAIDAIEAVAKETGMEMITLALRWVISNLAVTTPIVGASRPEQLGASIAAAEAGPLPADVKARLDEITHQFRAVDADR